MSRLLAGYAAGRIAFGAAALAAPARVADVLVGPSGREVAPRTLMANFGTRDVLLGAGLARALASGEGARAWLAAGFAADVLDVGVQLREWSDLPEDKRLPGVLFAGVAAVGGAALLLAGPDADSR
jgi:hypothetical protein